MICAAIYGFSNLFNPLSTAERMTEYGSRSCEREPLMIWMDAGKCFDRYFLTAWR